MKRPAGRPVGRLLQSGQKTGLVSIEAEAVREQQQRIQDAFQSSRTRQQSKTGRVRKMKGSRIIPRLGDERTGWITVTFTGMENN